MHDDLRWNKLFGAILGTALFMMLLGVGTQMFFTVKPPAKAGDVIAIQETATDGGDAKPDVPPDWGTVLKTADVSAGQTVSTKCQSCHNFANGGPNQTGPNLWGVIGRPPGTHAGFAYSSAMQDFGKKTPVWDYNHIYMFLAGPQNYISGTKMSFVGLKKPEDRINVIAWLRQQSSSPVAIPAPNPAAQTDAAAAAGKGPKGATGNDVAKTPGAGAKQPVAVSGREPTAEQSSTQVAPTSGAAGVAPTMNSNPGNGGGH